MILKADFRCKQVALEVEACVVEKVVELSTAEFDQFCRSMLEKYRLMASHASPQNLPFIRW